MFGSEKAKQPMFQYIFSFLLALAKFQIGTNLENTEF